MAEVKELESITPDLAERVRDLVREANRFGAEGKHDEAKKIFGLEAAPLSEKLFNSPHIKPGERAILGIETASLYLRGEDYENAVRIATICKEDNDPYPPG